MNFKLKSLAAALLVIAAAPASAQILDSVSGDGELFLSAWDTTNQVSYTRDLGIPLSAAGATNFTSSTDAKWTTFLGMVADPTTLVWNVVAGDSVGGVALSLNWLSTSLAPAATVGNVFNTNLSQFVTVNNTIGAVNDLDGTGPGNFAANVSTIVNGATDPTAYAGYGTFGDHFGSKETAFSNAAVVGQGMNFYLLQNSSTLAANKIKVTQFVDPTSGAPATMTLAADGTLSYVVTAVPVPAAVWLFGSGLVGMVGVARRKRSVA